MQTSFAQNNIFIKDMNSTKFQVAEQDSQTTQLEILARDKVHHFMGSVFLTVLVSKTVQNHFNVKTEQSKRIAVGLTLGTGLLKEFYDGSKQNNRFSWKDMLANIIGTGVGMVLLNQP